VTYGPLLPLFGTDGIRGTFGVAPFCPQSLRCIAHAVARFVGERISDPIPHVFLAQDTRFSGALIQEVLKGILESSGIQVTVCGVLPTPAVSFLVRHHHASLGIMISASHNPAPDNGLKFFDARGMKLQSSDEQIIEKFYEEVSAEYTGDVEEGWPAVPGVGDFKASTASFGEAYLSFVKKTLGEGVDFQGLRVVLDCAHGATYALAPQIFKDFGAEVILIGASPDGHNINAGCGALALEGLQQDVISHQADWGIAFDGDGDRVLCVDATGHVLDGDQMLAFLACIWDSQGLLEGSSGRRVVVSTVMANQALETFLRARHIDLVRARVGDRHVFHHMCARDSPLGAEPSGHLILRDFLPSGDGLLAALHLMKGLLSQKKLLAEEDRLTLPLFQPLPHVLTHVPLPDSSILKSPHVQEVLAQAEARIQHKGGRLLVRASGTEPIVRIMVEGGCRSWIEEEAETLKACFKAAVPS